MNPHEAQTALWYIPSQAGLLWWSICAVAAGTAALTMFLYLIMNQKFSGLLLSRMIITMSLVCFALVPLNSGWLPWGVLLASFGGLYASFLIATNWCDRHDKWEVLMSIFRRRQEQNGRSGEVLERRSRHIWRP